MKKILSVALISAGLMSANAFAFDGTVNFQGEITAVTCSISVNGGGPTSTVVLPSVAVTAFSTSQTAGATPFNFALSGCSPSSVNAHVFYETDSPAIDGTTGRLNNTDAGGATGVQLQLLNENLAVINLAAVDGSQSAITHAVDMGSATIPFTVRYFAPVAGSVTAGVVTSAVNYSMVYN